MVVCPDCGKEVPDAKFCKNCGARLPEVEKDIDNVIDDIQPKIDSNDAENEVAESGSENIQTFADFLKTKDSSDSSKSVKKIKFCPNCGNSIEGNFRFCPDCGCDLESPVVKSNTNAVTVPAQKNIILSIVLSVIFPGLGQIYLGLDKKGAYFLIGYVISAILILLVIGLILCLIIWIWALVDVIQSTNRLNRGETVEDKLF